jgi:hypothetical protein
VSEHVFTHVAAHWIEEVDRAWVEATHLLSAMILPSIFRCSTSGVLRRTCRTSSARSSSGARSPWYATIDTIVAV